MKFRYRLGFVAWNHWSLLYKTVTLGLFSRLKSVEDCVDLTRLRWINDGILWLRRKFYNEIIVRWVNTDLSSIKSNLSHSVKVFPWLILHNYFHWIFSFSLPISRFLSSWNLLGCKKKNYLISSFMKNTNKPTHLTIHFWGCILLHITKFKFPHMRHTFAL